jgi:hypothetical protein
MQFSARFLSDVIEKSSLSILRFFINLSEILIRIRN